MGYKEKREAGMGWCGARWRGVEAEWCGVGWGKVGERCKKSLWCRRELAECTF